MKFVEAISFTGKAQINTTFNIWFTNNALFAKSAFTFFISNIGRCCWTVSWNKYYHAPSLFLSNIRFSLWWPTYRPIIRFTLIQQSTSNLKWKLQYTQRKADLLINDTTVLSLPCIYLHNELILPNTISWFARASCKRQWAYQLGPHPP